MNEVNVAELAILDRTSEVTAFSAAARWTGVMSHERDRWLELRRTVLTASDVAAVLGYDQHRDAFDVYAEKTTSRKEPEVLTLDDPRFWGNVLEQPVLRAVAEYHGWNYRPGGALLVSRAHPWLGATLDAEIDRGAGWLDLEGKTTRVPRDWHQDEERLPIRVLVQVQSQLLVSGAQGAVVFALLQGSRPCQIDLEPHPDLHTVIREVGEEFMAQVARLQPPEPTDKSTRALNRLFPENHDGIVPLPAESIDWTREMRELQATVKTAERRVEELKNKLKACIGSATYGELPEPVDGKRFWRWQTQEAKAYTVEAKSFRTLLQIKGPDVAPARR
jgi:putative phage-type endonuclease